MVPKQPKLNLKSRALRFLSLREHSRLELGRKLVRYAEDGDDIEALLDFLESKKFLSGERFSESLIRRRSESYGNQRILAELQTHGLDLTLSDQSKAELAESEVARARAVWQKKFGGLRKISDSEDSQDVADEDNCNARDGNEDGFNENWANDDAVDGAVANGAVANGTMAKSAFGNRSKLKNAKSLELDQRAKQIRYLMQRGFSGKAIKAALSADFDGVDEIE